MSGNSITFTFILTISIIIASVHMIAPDHWAPLAALSVSRKYSRSRTSRIAFLLGASHAGISVAVGALVVLLGLILSSFYSDALFVATEATLIVVAAYFLLNGYSERKETGKSELYENSVLLVSIFPDFAIIPLMVYAFAMGSLKFSLIIIVFILSSALSLMIVTILSKRALGRIISRIKPNIMDYIISLILVLTAIFIYFTSI